MLASPSGVGVVGTRQGPGRGQGLGADGEDGIGTMPSVEELKDGLTLGDAADAVTVGEGIVKLIRWLIF